MTEPLLSAIIMTDLDSRHDLKKPERVAKLTEAQLRFLDLCKRVGWGVLEVKVKNGQPVMASLIRQDFKLD